MGDKNAELLCDLLAGRGELLQSLKDLKKATAWTRPEPNEWSVVEVLQHVADADTGYVGRLQDVLEGKPEMRNIDRSQWEGARAAAEKDGLPGVLRRVYTTKLQMLEVVSGMTAADLEKSSKHPIRGPMTAGQLVALMVKHDRDHTEQIAKARAVVEK